VEQGNPPDVPQLAPAVQRIAQRTCRTPRTVTADRGYGEQKVEDALHDAGVRNVVIPRKGKPGTARKFTEHRRAFRRTVKWRTGIEGRISILKRGYGWDRTLIDGTDGARIWTGHGGADPQPGQDQHPGRMIKAPRAETAATREYGQCPVSGQADFFRSE
jgi:IS5 family transposase